MTDELLKWNQYLLGAPSGVLVAAVAIVIGYVLRTIPQFNNKYIPLFVVVFCTVIFMLIAPARLPEMPERIWLVRNLCIGLIIGFASWTFHAQLLARFVDPKLFPPEPTDPPKP